MRLSLLLLLVAATATLAGPQGEKPEAVPGAGSTSVIKEPEFQDRVEEQERLLFQLAKCNELSLEPVSLVGTDAQALVTGVYSITRMEPDIPKKVSSFTFEGLIWDPRPRENVPLFSYERTWGRERLFSPKVGTENLVGHSSLLRWNQWEVHHEG